MADLFRRQPLTELEREELGDRVRKMTRRGVVGGFAGITAMAATLGVGRHVKAADALASVGLLPEDLPAKAYRAATSEIFFGSTWVSHGVETARFYGELLGVDVQSFDGENDPPTQLEVMQTISTEDWDFVAVHPSASEALKEPADAIIAKGTPLIVMDTRLIQDPEEFANYGHLTYLEPDNIYMGSTVATELMRAIGGTGEVIHTRGQLGHTGSQGRYDGFNQTVANYPDVTVVDETPGNWDPAETAALWQDLLQRYPNVVGGYFHSDDMALAARTTIEDAGMGDQVKVVGVDGLKNACEAILADRLTATVINPSGRIHGGAIWAGYYAVSGTDNAESMPKFIRTDGGPIIKDTAAGYIWLHDNFLY